jgi:hypothetical protein
MTVAARAAAWRSMRRYSSTLSALALSAVALKAQAQMMECPTASSPPPTVRFLTQAQTGQALVNFGAPSSSTTGLEIVFQLGPNIAANAEARAALQRAADQWQLRILSRVRIELAVELGPLPPNAPPRTIGGTQSVIIGINAQLVRDKLVEAAQRDFDDAIVNSLPAQVAGSFLIFNFPFLELVIATKANLKAIGFQNLDLIPNEPDARITFNDAVAFDFDNRNGLDHDTFDFETVIAHEIGHALGFHSAVDLADVAMEQDIDLPALPVFPLDFYRFQNDTPIDPGTIDQFTAFPRFVDVSTASNFDDLQRERGLSTGVFFGDGNQASHWKDFFQTNVLLGIMNPRIDEEMTFRVGTNDLRALDLIGYSIALPGNRTATRDLILEP